MKKKPKRATIQKKILAGSHDFSINNNPIGLNSLRLKVTSQELLNYPVIGDAIMPKKNIYYDYICNSNRRVNKIQFIKPTSRNELKVNLLNQISELRKKINYNHDLISSYSPVILEARRAIDEITIGYDKLKGTERNKSGNLIRPDPMEDLIKEYHNCKIKLPRFRSIEKENLFKKNPLLQVGSDIEKYYMFYREKSVEKHVNKYLSKINSLYNQKIVPNSNERERQRVLNQNENNKDKDPEYIQKKPVKIEKEIDEMQREVNTIHKTINDMESMDEFYMTRQKRFNHMRNANDSSLNLKYIDKTDEQSNQGNGKDNSPSFGNNKILHSKSMKDLDNIFRLKEQKHLSINFLYQECLIKHLKQLRKSVLIRNFIMEDYNIRRDKNHFFPFSPFQKKILKKNRIIEQGIRKAEDQTLRIILKQSVDD